MGYEDIFGLFGGTFDMRGSEDIFDMYGGASVIQGSAKDIWTLDSSRRAPTAKVNAGQRLCINYCQLLLEPNNRQ